MLCWGTNLGLHRAVFQWPWSTAHHHIASPVEEMIRRCSLSRSMNHFVHLILKLFLLACANFSMISTVHKTAKRMHWVCPFKNPNILEVIHSTIKGWVAESWHNSFVSNRSSGQILGHWISTNHCFFGSEVLSFGRSFHHFKHFHDTQLNPSYVSKPIGLKCYQAHQLQVAID